MASLRHTPEGNSPETSPAQQACLDAARESILAVGWSRTTLTEVARRAGVSRMTIYRAWSDRELLLGDLMTREWRATLPLVSPSPPQTRDDLVEAVLQTVTALRENPLFERILQLDPTLLLPYLLDRRGRSQDAMLDLLVPSLARLQDAGELREEDPTVLARMLLLTGHGLAMSLQTMTDDAVDKDALLTAYATLLREGLAR